MKRLLPKRNREKPQIVVTNLIDVILLLVFFFMITSSFAKEARRIPLDLPAAGSSGAIEGETLTFQMDKQGTVFSGGKSLEAGDISIRVKEYLGAGRDRQILVEADKALDYGKVIAALDTIRTAGGTNLGLATRTSTEKR